MERRRFAVESGSVSPMGRLRWTSCVVSAPVPPGSGPCHISPTASTSESVGTLAARGRSRRDGVTDAPLTVVASPSQIRNRPPNPVAALQLLPEDPTAEDVLQCQVIDISS